MPDPEKLPPADYLIMESTYGDRLHAPIGHAADKLAEVVNRTAARGGKLIVPTFAVGRTQQLVLLLHQLIDAKRIPAIPMFVDSPLAVNATEVFREHPECYDEEARKFLTEGQDPFGFFRLKYIRDVAQSKALNGRVTRQRLELDLTGDNPVSQFSVQAVFFDRFSGACMVVCFSIISIKTT